MRDAVIWMLALRVGLLGVIAGATRRHSLDMASYPDAECSIAPSF